MADEKVKHLTDDNFNETIKSGLTLVDFWADWCGPCLSLAPTINEMADTYDGQITVGKVDVDQHKSIATRFGVRGIPTVILFKDGEQADIFTGSAPNKIRDMVERAL